MASAAEPLSGLPQAEASQDLARSWKKLTRAATIVRYAARSDHSPDDAISADPHRRAIQTSGRRSRQSEVTICSASPAPTLNAYTLSSVAT